MSDLDVLRTLRDQIVPPPLDVLRETARRRARRSNALGVLAASAAVVALAATTVVVAGDDADRSPLPIQPPEPSSRPLTYADGAVVHYGDRTVDAAGPVVELDLTDQGVAFRTADGRIWFTDGASVDELGALGEPGPVFTDDTWPPLVHDGWLVSAHSGSTVAWFEFRRLGVAEVVVYDTAAGAFVNRTDVALDDGGAFPGAVTDRYVYWFGDTGPDADDIPDVRYDPGTGEQVPVSPEQIQDDLRSQGAPRTILIGSGGPLRVTDGTDRNFSIEGGRVTPQGEQPLTAEDGLTGKRFAFDAPPDYPRQVAAYLTQWLDDQTIVLVSARAGGDDLIVCRVDTRACEVVNSGPSSLVLPEVG